MPGTKPATGSGKSSGSHLGTKTQKWPANVTRRSNALDLEAKIFTPSSPRTIATSLKHSAETSRRRKTTPFQSGKKLPRQQRDVLERSKDELRKAFRRAGSKK